MVDVKNESSSSKGCKRVVVECLICYQEIPSKNLDHIYDTDEAEYEELKRVLCVALKIKIAKKYSSDRLLFCRKCKEIVTRLKDVDLELQKLQHSFQEQAELLQTLLKEGATKTANEAKGTCEEDDDDVVVHVRRQVLGLLGIKSRSKSKKKGLNEDSSTQRAKKTETLRRASKILLQSDGLRRSRRNIVSNKNKQIVSEEREEAKEVEDIGITPTAIKTDTADSDYFDNGYIPECTDNTGDHRLKSEVEVKQEQVSESDVDLIPEDLCEPICEKTTNEANKKTKRKRKQVLVQSVLTKRKRKSKPVESTCESDWTSDVDESRDDFSTEDDEPKNRPTYRKWKNDKTERRLWYDGIEVFILDGGYKCSKCDIIIEGDHNFKTRGKMKNHIIVKHLEKFSCVICNKITSCQKYLDQHIRMVHEKSVMVPCDICGKPFTSTNAMRRHKWSHQSEEEKQEAIAAGKKQYGIGKLRLLVCETCGKLCKGPYNLRRHEETHVDQKERQKHMCSFCGSIYSAPESLRSHIKLAHENNNQLQWLQCPHCPKKYPQPGLLDKHMRVHTGLKPFVCEECGAGFSQPNLLKVHILKHKNIRPHKCSDCDMAFYRVYHLRRHREVYHESTNPPTKKQPYRSENGTRKTPQKRKKMSITLVPSSASVDSTVSEDASPKATTETVEDATSSQQMPVGSRNTKENFDFVPSEGTFSFTTYTFTASADSQD